ncbi:hypothetical protein [Halocola ammonii]
MFAKKGWHDSLSNTTVVIEARSYSDDSSGKMQDENETSEASGNSENIEGNTNF